MKTLTTAVSVVAVAIGLGGGVASYALTAGPAAPIKHVSAPETPDASPTAEASEEPVVKFKPCKAPAHREGKHCVEDVVETVVVPAPATGPTKSSGHHGNNQSDDSETTHEPKDDKSGSADDDSSATPTPQPGHDDDGDDEGVDDHGDDPTPEPQDD